jgi:growth factor-regulated tyrosine kinase substrate
MYLFFLIIQIGGSAQVRSKALAYLQNWGLSFKENMSLCYMTTVYEAFKSQGTKFPPVDKSQIGSVMIDTTTAPEWSDSEVCVRCRTRFTTFNRKHHCRNCGSTFCNDCSSNKASLPHLGVTEEVRVCDGCFGKISSGIVPVVKDTKNPTISKDVDSDEDLQKAIAASLEEAKETKKSKEKSKKEKSKKKKISFADDSKTLAEKEAEDLEAAIQASLLESKKEPVSKEENLPPYPRIPPAELYHDEAQTLPKKPIPAPVEELINPAPSFDLSRTEIENLHLFSELVEKTDAQVALRGIQTLNPVQLQVLI